MSGYALAAGVRYFCSQLALQCSKDDSDEELLHAFLMRRDEGAFAVLVRRHGPMVLHVCRPTAAKAKLVRLSRSCKTATNLSSFRRKRKPTLRAGTKFTGFAKRSATS